MLGSANGAGKMHDRILVKACAASNRNALIALAIMICIAVASAAVAITLSFGGSKQIRETMDALGYGDVTVWVEGSDANEIARQIEETPGVESVSVQPLVFSPYTVNGHHSDDEGQLLAYDPNLVPYRSLDAENGFAPEEALSVRQGEIYVSAAMIDTAQVHPQDIISFRLSRTGATFDFKVAGYFEDGFMGSSMVDMKSFLISQEDLSAIKNLVAAEGSFDGLAKQGCMVHVFQDADTHSLPILEGGSTQPTTSGDASIAFSHTRDSMAAYQLLQLNIIAGFLVALAIAFALVALFVSSRAVAAAIEANRLDIIALKTTGYGNGRLARVYGMTFGAASLLGCLVGYAIAVAVLRLLPPILAPITGISMTLSANIAATCLICAFLITATLIVVFAKLRRMTDISPIAGSDEIGNVDARLLKRVSLSTRTPSISLALKALAAHAGSYASIFAVTLLLVLLVCSVARLSTWVGPHGEGLMEAFSAADHDIGIQPLGPMDIGAAEDVIAQHDQINAVYALAMEPVSVGGQQLTANVIDNASYFHIIEGSAPQTDQEVVVTAMAASALGVNVGDDVAVAGSEGVAEYQVAGIYLCANEMGQNLGMTMQGYERIGDVGGYIWCYHYVLADGSRNEQILQELTSRFGNVAAIHSNSWSGLDGLIDASRMLLVAAFVLSAVLVMVACALSSSRAIASERRDIAIEKMLGFASARLRRTFVVRIAVVTTLGAIAGSLLSAVSADNVFGVLLASSGIGSFHAASTFANTILPALAIVLFAIAAAWWSSRSVCKVVPVKLLTDDQR